MEKDAEKSYSDDIYLSNGNIRMSCTIFNLPSFITCPGHTEMCSKYCYAQKAEDLYPNVLPCRMRNLRAAKHWTFVPRMISLLKSKRSKLFRIHESGDFFDQEYLDKWIQIMEKFPDKVFLAYTQSYDLDFSGIPDNMVLYYSVWPDSKNVPEEGLKAYVVDDGSGLIDESHIPDKNKLFRCKKGRGKELTCNDCMRCFEGRGDVLFKLH